MIFLYLIRILFPLNALELFFSSIAFVLEVIDLSLFSVLLFLLIWDFYVIQSNRKPKNYE